MLIAPVPAPLDHQRPSSASAARAPLHHPVAREAHDDRGAPPDESEGDHADHHRHRHVVHVGIDDEVAETPVSRHHLRRDEGEPRHPDADLQAGEDERQRAGHDDMTEDLPLARPETAGRAEVRFVDGLHAEHRVQRGHEQRGEGCEEDDRGLETREHQDGQRHPGEDRDGAQDLEKGKGEVPERHRPAHEQPQRNPESGRDAEGEENPPAAHPDVLVVFRGEDRDALERLAGEEIRQHRHRTGHLFEAGQVPDLAEQPPQRQPRRDAQHRQVRAGGPDRAYDAIGEQRHPARRLGPLAGYGFDGTAGHEIRFLTRVRGSAPGIAFAASPWDTRLQWRTETPSA